MGAEKLEKLPICMGRVNEVKVVEDNVLLPLTPLDERGTHFMATIIYDLHKLGYDKEDMVHYYKDFLKKNSIQNIVSHIEGNGRMIWEDVSARHNNKTKIVRG